MDAALLVAMILIGVFTGIVTGLTGASGVMVVVPLTTVLLGFPIHEAIGTSLMVNVVSSLAITYIYYKNGNVDLRSGIWIAIGSVAGAQMGAVFAGSMPEVGLGGAFGFFMVAMGRSDMEEGFKP